MAFVLSAGSLRMLSQLRNASGVLVAVELGLVDYDTALQLQTTLRDRRIRGHAPDLLLLLEHPPVYTLGRNAKRIHLGSAATVKAPVRRVGRGGEVTFHGPGQLVGYPIIDLCRLGGDVHAYVRSLENSLIRAVESFGVPGERKPGHPGVWVGGHKLASIGIGVRKWVTTHGFALNVTTDLDYFDGIVPCGLTGVEMTSLAAKGASPVPQEVQLQVAKELARELRCRLVRLTGCFDREHLRLKGPHQGPDSVRPRHELATESDVEPMSDQG